jgi:SH3 domain protein
MRGHFKENIDRWADFNKEYAAFQHPRISIILLKGEVMQVPLKIAGSFIVLWILLVAAALAESKYVSEDFEITLRTGPGADRKIIALIPSGRAVEIVTPGEEWTEVVTPGGKQGWVLSRYLTDLIPTAVKLERLQQRYDKMRTDYDALRQREGTLSEENQRLSKELGQTQTNLVELSDAHDTLKNESADFIKLKEKYDSTVKALEETRSKAQTAESELNKLMGSEFNKGLLWGGGLLFFGMILGFILKRPKRRVPLM